MKLINLKNYFENIIKNQNKLIMKHIFIELEEQVDLEIKELPLIQLINLILSQLGKFKLIIKIISKKLM